MVPTFARQLRSSSLAMPSLLAGVLALSGPPARALSAQAATCDPSLESSTSDPYAYRPRGDRCEGIYAQPVAGTPLVVASFTRRFDTYDPDSASRLVLSWAARGPAVVRLRAIALRRRFYYRMDARQSADAGSWTWPADLLVALHLGRPELGVVAWTRERSGGTERDVHLPLRIDGGGDGGTADAYTLVVLPQVELAELFVTVARTEEDGRVAAYLRDEEPLGYGYYPADRPIDVAIARPAAPGLYRVLLGARIRGGGSVATELWFRRAPA